MTTHLPRQPLPKNQDLPPLENGDRLNRPEFELTLYYMAIPDGKLLYETLRER